MRYQYKVSTVNLFFIQGGPKFSGQIEKYSCLFFSNEGHFCIYLIVQIVGSSQILLDFVLSFKLRLAFQMTNIRSITSLFITCDQVIDLPNHVTRSPR